MTDTNKAAYYLDLDYPVLVTRDSETRAFVLEVPDWPGCVADGDSLEAAFRKLHNSRATWVEDSLERGLEIPLPRPSEDYSGKFLLRVPRSLHRRLTDLARQEDVSLNAYVSTVLADHVGASQGERRLREAAAEVTACLNELKQQVKNRTSFAASGSLLGTTQVRYITTNTRPTGSLKAIFGRSRQEDEIDIADLKLGESPSWFVGVK